MIGSSNTDAGTSSSQGKNETPSTTQGQSDESQQELKALITEWQGMSFEESSLPSLIEDVGSADIKKQFYGVVGLRKLLCCEKKPPIQRVLDTGIVPTLIQLVQVSSESELQFEAAWCLTNLCSGTSAQAEVVIENGVIQSFINGLGSPSHDLIEQCLWGLGNIAGDSSKFRDMVIESGAIEPMANILESVTKLSMKRNGTWALSNICRGKPAPPFGLVARTVPVFANFLKNDPDEEVLVDSAWGLSYCSATNEGIDAVLSQDVTLRLAELLGHHFTGLILPVLRVVGNIISGNDEQTGKMLKELKLLPNLLALTSNQKKTIRKETFWILSHIAAGPPVQFESIMGNSAFVEKIIYAASNDSHEVRREAAYVLSNSTSSCTPAQIFRLLNNGVFNCLIELLDSTNDQRILLVALEGVGNCLKWGSEFNLNNEDGKNKFVVQMEEVGGLDKLEALQSHAKNEVYEMAIKILETYFVIEEDQEQ